MITMILVELKQAVIDVCKWIADINVAEPNHAYIRIERQRDEE